MLYALCEFFARSRALARRRAAVRTLPGADWVRNPSLCARGSPYTWRGDTRGATPQRLHTHHAHMTFSPATHSLHFACVCYPTAASVFIYALIFFHNGVAQRTLETVCVIDDKTKYSARWFPYFWNSKSIIVSRRVQKYHCDKNNGSLNEIFLYKIIQSVVKGNKYCIV